MASRTRGFTLIELVVAVAIFAAIAGIAYSSVAALIRARERLELAEANLRALQTSVSNFERDLRSAVARPVREAYGDARPALIGERNGVTLTRLRSGGLADASAQSQRVGYMLESGQWNRVSWPVADAAPSTTPRNTKLLEAVERISMRYLDAEGVWREVWPAPNLAAPSQLSALPRAVELQVTVTGFGTLQRVIELPNPEPDGAAGPSPGETRTP